MASGLVSYSKSYQENSSSFILIHSSYTHVLSVFHKSAVLQVLEIQQGTRQNSCLCRAYILTEKRDEEYNIDMAMPGRDKV